MNRIPALSRGKIQYISPALDPTTRTLQARIEANNPGERLKKEMYVTAEVQAGVIPDALFVPDSSVLRDEQNMPYVYLQRGNSQFARRDVTLGESQERKDANPDRVASERPRGRRRQPFPAIPEFAPALRGTGPR
jgi:multidrug efflux pump subunit AcrA (membrane-fusion protein)